MKFLLMSIGTRGDVEPFLAIAEILKKQGHQVVCAFPDQFRSLAEESNLKFYSLGVKFIELLESADGKAAMGGDCSGFTKMLAYFKLAKASTEVNKELVLKQYEIVQREEPDRIVYSGKAIYPILWGLENTGKNILVSPIPYMHYVRDHTHVAFNSNYGSFLNRLTYSLANFGMVTTVMMTKKWLKDDRKISRRQVYSVIENSMAIYSISPTLFTRRDYWPKNVQVLGFHERTLPTDEPVDKKLEAFLKKHDRILFITFGSMTNPEPEEKTKTIIEVLERNRIPAIINTASGGLVKPKFYDSELLFFVSNIPYNWIFPKMYAVIHHGGSGTTHLALKHGCASMIIPHIIDQFVWDKIIHETGVGPRGVRINKLNPKTFESKVLDLLQNEKYKAKALEISESMKKEDLVERLVNAILK